MSVNATDAAETIINFTGISLYQLLAGVAGIAATATGILAWRLSALTTRVNDMKETIDKLGENVRYMERLKQEEAHHIVQNFYAELKKSMDKSSQQQGGSNITK